MLIIGEIVARGTVNFPVYFSGNLKLFKKKKKIYKLKKNENKKCYMVVIQFAMIANVCEKVILIYLVNSWSNFKKIFLIIKENKNLKDLKIFQ